MAAKQLKKKTPPKINKNALPSAEKQIVHVDELYRCTCCGHPYRKQSGNFYGSKSPIYAGNNGFMSICKKCLQQLYDQFVEFYDKDEDAAMERICQFMDIYMDDASWDMARKAQGKNPNNRIGFYMQKLNLSQSKGTTYEDTLVNRWELERKAREEEEKRIEEETEEAWREQMTAEGIDRLDGLQASIKRFGLGFDDDGYIMMQNEYDDWVRRYGPPDDKRQEELYVSICYLKFNFQKSVKNDASGIGALANSYKSMIDAATTEIEDRKKKKEAEIRQEPLGVWIKDIEKYSPAEFFKDKKLYEDYDSLGEYITRFLTRPFRNLFTGTKELDREFNLPETEE